nr:unnamed protein product [Callosobruchus analis]
MKLLLRIFDIWDKSAAPMKEAKFHQALIEVTFLSCGGSGVRIDVAGVVTEAGELVTRAGGVTERAGEVTPGAAAVSTAVEVATTGAGSATGTVEFTTGSVRVASGTDDSVIGIRSLGAGSCTTCSWQGAVSSVGSPVPVSLSWSVSE